jgi:plasmid stabilization system protein ParE
MDRKVIWADAAIADLEAAAEFISKDSPAYAAAFVHRSLESARSLNDLAERGRVVPEFKDETIREIFVHSYRLIYQVEENRVSVLALIHGRRNFASAWGERER